jgi:hypothetical protein
MYIQPRSFLSRLLGAAWTILLIAVLLWVAAHLLADAGIWVVVIIAVTAVIRVGIWLRRWRRERW